MTTDTVKNAKMNTESVGNFVFFDTLTTEKSITGLRFNGHADAIYAWKLCAAVTDYY